MTMLVAQDITVHAGAQALVNPVSLTLEAGKAVTILGESGSGKSLLAQAILGTLPESLNAAGRLAVGDRRFDPAKPRSNRALWGRHIAVLPQEPWLALDPLMSARKQVAEVHEVLRSDQQPDTRADADLAALGLSGAERKFPWELSGGMAQRLAFAAARAGGAAITVADEPTKGLDAGRRDDVLALLRRGIESGGGLLTITHDLQLAAGLGGEILVMQGGDVVERGPVERILSTPEHPYTQALVASDPAHWPRRVAPQEASPMIRAQGLQVSRNGRQLFAPVSFELAPGQILGVFGPSGCGKSSLGNALLSLLPMKARCGGIQPCRSFGIRSFGRTHPPPFLLGSP